jgi:hypothetical protein
MGRTKPGYATYREIGDCLLCDVSGVRRQSEMFETDIPREFEALARQSERELFDDEMLIEFLDDESPGWAEAN